MFFYKLIQRFKSWNKRVMFAGCGYNLQFKLCWIVWKLCKITGSLIKNHNLVEITSWSISQYINPVGKMIQIFQLEFTNSEL